MECVRLRAEDLRYEEIAVVLGLQAGTVGALLARAHEKMRKAAVHKNGDLAPAALEEKRYAS
jgi:DNA-directed RNA polymerase specialized sigma24 family protein